MRQSLIATFLCLVLCALAQAQTVPSLVNYQGKLTGADGSPLADGAYDIEFRVWNVPLAGDPGEQLVWGAKYTVTVVDGRFNVILGAPGGGAVSTVVGDPGSGTAPAVNDIGYAFSAPERYMGLSVVVALGTPVAAPTEISPRQQILSAPFALAAGHADMADVASQLASFDYAQSEVATHATINSNVTTWTPIPGLDTTLSVSVGRPVLVGLTSTARDLSAVIQPGSSASIELRIMRSKDGGAAQAVSGWKAFGMDTVIMPLSMHVIDTVPASGGPGNYRYTVEYKTPFAASIGGISYPRLYAFRL